MKKHQKTALLKVLGTISLGFFLSACSDSDTDSPSSVTDSPNSVVAATDNTSTTTPVVGLGTSASFQSQPSSVISGNISIISDGLPAGDVQITARGTENQSIVQADGEYFLVVPKSDSDQVITLDITGGGVVEKSVQMQIPANSDRAVLNTTVSTRTPAIPFNLETGGEMRNVDSAVRTTVSVPANAFEFEDGTVATGMAEVNITELDTLDLAADYSWAPNFIGIAEGSDQPTAIATFGMSEFHFSQNGRELNLRPGVEATLSMDLAQPFIATDDSADLVPAFDGATMPLWHFDINDTVWREEGDVVIRTDNESASGFTATGNVSHFSYWNVDWAVPFVEADVNIVVVDQNGTPRNDVNVTTYDTRARIPEEDGSDHGGTGRLTTWINDQVLTPRHNKIRVFSNLPWRVDIASMDISVKDVNTEDHGIISSGVMTQRKAFFIDSNDRSVYFEVVVPTLPDPTPELTTGDIVIELVDLEGREITGLNISSFTISAQSSDGWSNPNVLLTPSNNNVVLTGNSPGYLQSGGTPVSTTLTLDKVVVEGKGELNLLSPVSVSQVFSTNSSDNKVVFTVPTVDL